MPRTDKKIKLFGEVLQEGVWIYVAEVKHFQKRLFLYIGKTGKKGTTTPTSPWSRLAAHLDDAAVPFNCLKYHLESKLKVNINECVFEMSCFGPKLVDSSVPPEVEHEIIQEVEFQLAKKIRNANYAVIGNHKSVPSRTSAAMPIVDHIVTTLKRAYLKNLK